MKLFVAGIPGTGKTYFGDKLRDEFGFMHIDFERLSPDWQQLHLNIRLRAFLEKMAQFSRCLVGTWGFPIQYLPDVEALADSDVRLVWFDGDREFALKAWRRGKGRSDDTDFRRQIEAIESCIEKIKPLFSKDWIDTFSAEGVPLSPEQILDLLSIRPCFRAV